MITDLIFTFYNYITKEVQKTHPGKYIVCLAYSRYSEPPVNVEIHPYLIPQYCLWSSYKYANSQIRDQHQKIVSEWSSQADEMGIYEYFINDSWLGLYRLIIPFISESIKDFYRNGVKLYQTHSGDEFALNGLNYYVAGKLLWNTSLNTEIILNDFYKNAFGKSGSAIKIFHQQLIDESRWVKKGNKSVGVGHQSFTVKMSIKRSILRLQISAVFIMKIMHCWLIASYACQKYGQPMFPDVMKQKFLIVKKFLKPNRNLSLTL